MMKRVIYTGCPRRNVQYFGRVFLMWKYADITQNTYVQSCIYNIYVIDFFSSKRSSFQKIILMPHTRHYPSSMYLNSHDVAWFVLEIPNTSLYVALNRAYIWLPSDETAVGKDRFMHYTVYDLIGELDYNVMAHAQRTVFVYGRNGRVCVLLQQMWREGSSVYCWQMVRALEGLAVG
jgi:hypothetical protein